MSFNENLTGLCVMDERGEFITRTLDNLISGFYSELID
ncbi:hypothetical protein VCE7224_00102 [Vibrio celticus]|uniref:Uncharacterized protein n=1 Tax=Vibrio celticus TaxID=446372 RepID=A0A1C3J8K6_9VIBR|nr:hypothetical protein VCE7224_00102 [Vibrio celticus]